MRSEIHTVNLIRASSNIRQLISRLLESSIKPWEAEYVDDLLSRLPLKESLTTLTELLDCDEEEVFQRIAARADALVTEQYPLNFTLDHLRELDSMEAHSHLSSIFKCDPWDALEELLDVQAMLDTLFEVAPEMVRHMLRSGVQYDVPFPSASEAVRNILLAHRRIEEHFDIDEHKWNLIVDKHNWLKGSAIDKLLCFCAEHGIIQRSGAGILAAILQNDTPYEKSDEIRLDALAVIHIQQRINWIVRQLQERAEELAHMASTSVDKSSPWAWLEQVLNFYELKAPAGAWRVVIKPTVVKRMTIRERLSQIDIHSTGRSGTPKKSSYMKVRAEAFKGNPPLRRFLGRGVIAQNLIVSCQIEESDLLCDILICNKVQPAQVPFLEQFFSSIPAVTAASGWVPDIGGQLLLAPLISSDSFRDVLINACADFSREIIQGLILAGVKLLSRLDSVLGERLNYEASIKPVQYDQDIVYPVSHIDVIDIIKNEYIGQDNVRIIK